MFESSAANILLVQAEPVLAELTSFRLELLGYQLNVVNEGGEAKSIIQNSLPDLVVVDTSLRDGDGIEWISQIRVEHGHEQLPIIVLSLDPSLETVERAFHAGANDYLIAPYDPIVMEEKVEKMLAQYAMSR